MGKTHIYYIIGKSASGKDTICSKVLEAANVFFGSGVITKIIPYTTRPKRTGEKNGIDYFFVNNDKFEQLKSENKIIEYRSYNTVYGVWNYFTYFNILKGIHYITIGTIESYLNMKKYFENDSDIEINPIYIEVPDHVRLARAAFREHRENKTPNYIEVCRRFTKDEEDFSEEKIKAAGITTRFENGANSDADALILAYIASTIGR